MDCNEARQYLDAVRTGEIDTEVRRTVSEHLESCPACRDEAASLARLAEGIKPLKLIAPNGIMEGVTGMIIDRYDVIETEFGPAHVGFTPRGISAVKLGVEEDGVFETYYEDRLGRKVARGSLPGKYANAVRKAIMGEKNIPPPVTLEGLTGFERTVLEHLAKIPLGEVRPYAWLAREVGRPKAIRAVGTVMARNPVPFLMPCHRLVPSVGRRRELLLRPGDEMDAAGTGGDRPGGSCELETTRRSIRRQPNDRNLLLSDLPRRPPHPASASHGIHQCR